MMVKDVANKINEKHPDTLQKIVTLATAKDWWLDMYSDYYYMWQNRDFNVYLVEWCKNQGYKIVY